MDNKLPDQTPPVPTTPEQRRQEAPKIKSKPIHPILVIVCAVLLILIIFTLLVGKNRSTPIAVKPTPTPVPLEQHVVLSFQPSSLNISLAKAQSSYSLPIMIDSGTNHISAIQILLQYDPKLFTNVSLSKNNNFFPMGSQLFYRLNPVLGEISYALATAPQGKPIQGSSMLFTTLVIQLNPAIPRAELPLKTNISFVLKDTLIGDQNFHYSTLKSATGAEITISR